MSTKFERQIAFGAAHVLPRRYRNTHNLPHWHREHELILVTKGTLVLTVNGESFPLADGACALLCNEEVHNIRSDPDAVAVIVKLDPEYFDRLTGKRALLSPVLSHDYGLPAALDALFSELKPETEFGGIVADAIMTRHLAEILRGEPSTERPAVHRHTEENHKRLLDRISTDYAYVTFEDAAEFMHFSRPYFSKYFYTQTGMTFTRYLATVRISRACELVQEGHLTVTEISRRCGFNTIRSFNRVFRELTGYTPSTLPKDFRFIGGPKEYADRGFDPTLSSTEVLEG